MKCPVCADSTLQMTERQGVEIDYCNQCRGVWLDRGELDKIIDRVAQQQSPQPAAPAPPPQPPPQANPYPQQPYPPQQPPPYRGKDDSDYKFRYPGSQGGYHKKRKGFLGELFDFD